MPVTARSPMVCEQVVCPAPLLSLANKWTPVYGAMKVTYDELIHLKMSHCVDPVYKDACLPLLSFPLVLFLCVFYLFIYESLGLAVLKSEI